MEHQELYNRPDNLFRPPDWRWRRAADLVDGGGPLSPGHDDGPVEQAMGYLRAWRGCRAEADRQRLARDMPDLYAAHQLHLARSFQTWEAQARLLTEGPFEVIAEKCGSHPRVIETFHDTFFHVRDRRHVEGYVIFQVIGPKAHRGLTEADLDVILKMYAYFGGPVLVDQLVDYYKSPPPEVPERPEQLSPAELKSLRARLLVRASIVLDTLPAVGTPLKKLDLLLGAVDVFRRGRGPGESPEGLNVPLAACPGCREQLFKAPGRASGGAGDAPRGVAGGDQAGRHAAGPGLGESMLVPFAERDRPTAPSHSGWQGL
jgi:hypothetical protein